MTDDKLIYDKTDDAVVTTADRRNALYSPGADKYLTREAVIYQKLWIFAMKRPIYIPVRDKSQYRSLCSRLWRCLSPILHDKRIAWAKENLRMTLVIHQGRPCLRLGYDEILLEVKRLLIDLYRDYDLNTENPPLTTYEEVSRLYENDIVPAMELGDAIEETSNEVKERERRDFFRVLEIADTTNISDHKTRSEIRMNENTEYCRELADITMDELLQYEGRPPEAYMEEELNPPTQEEGEALVPPAKLTPIPNSVKPL